MFVIFQLYFPTSASGSCLQKASNALNIVSRSQESNMIHLWKSFLFAERERSGLTPRPEDGTLQLDFSAPTIVSDEPRREVVVKTPSPESSPRPEDPDIYQAQHPDLLLSDFGRGINNCKLTIKKKYKMIFLTNFFLSTGYADDIDPLEVVNHVIVDNERK